MSAPAASAALIAVGLVAARASRAGRRLIVRPRHWAAAVAGGLVIVLSCTLDAPRVMDGGLPGAYPWPVFVAGMLLAVLAAVDVLRRGRRAPAVAAG